MKKLVLNLISVLTGISLLSACAQTEEPQEINSHIESCTRSEESLSEEDFFLSSVETRVAIATWFANNYTIQDAKRIHNSVLQARKMGLDEIYYLKEFAAVSTSNNKVSCETPTEMSLKFGTDLCSKSSMEFSGVSMQSSTNSHNLFNHERLVIYWPYSDNWDGLTTPVVAFAPKKLSALKTEGFILNKGRMQSVIVDEEYCENHPVWLITESETLYSSLPNFSQGEMVSPDGVLYMANSAIKPRSIPGSPYPLDSLKFKPEPIYTLHLGYVRSEKNHDSWLAGGSEYVFKFMSLHNTNLTCESDTSKCQQNLATTKICFSRSDIKHHIPKHLDAVAVSKWPKSLENIAMNLIEEDWGNKEETFDATLNVIWKDKKYGIDISIPRLNYDDLIAERIYARDYISILR